jgi:hypothetical protein
MYMCVLGIKPRVLFMLGKHSTTNYIPAKFLILEKGCLGDNFCLFFKIWKCLTPPSHWLHRYWNNFPRHAKDHIQGLSSSGAAWESVFWFLILWI